ncbi:helix-turn-helix domain-containing protein [Arthrobacter sp. NPDC056886]|uniref:helix-turn-helix domain-containing protein n=1 Tax=Arthrobacter sp. NPDC056886 TaxID=3345960 RepID=UPI003670B40B
MMEQQFITIDEIAVMFRISRSTAYRFKKRDNWPSHRFGTEIRFSPEDVAAIQAKYAQTPAPERRTPRIGTRANKRNNK